LPWETGVRVMWAVKGVFVAGATAIGVVMRNTARATRGIKAVFFVFSPPLFFG